jgi:hypothetical protein
MLGLEDVLKQADFVTLHTTLTNGIRGLVGADELRLLKPGARLSWRTGHAETVSLCAQRAHPRLSVLLD